MRAFPEAKGCAIFPAIDVRGGRCVRLVKGARDAEIHYDDDPVKMARRWLAEGATCMHVIDLGAAFGEPDSTDPILDIVRAVDVPVQVGGGIRDEARLARLLDGGVARVILGTKAFRDPPFLFHAVDAHGPARVMVSVDCEGDVLRIGGWEEASPLGISDALHQVEDTGVQHVLVTATDRDGTFEGPRVDLIRRVLEDTRLRVVAAGGIGSVDDVRRVLSLRHPGLEGVVVGRALYEGRVRLPEAIRLISDIGDETS